MPKKSVQVVQILEKMEQEGETAELLKKYNGAKLESRYFNFPTKRRFWYNIGKPISMFYFGLVLMFVIPGILNHGVRRILFLMSILLIGIGSYFIIWCIWVKNDFPTQIYFYSIATMAAISPILSFFLINYRKGLRKTIRELFDYIIIDINDQYISEDQKKDYVKGYENQIKKALNG